MTWSINPEGKPSASYGTRKLEEVCEFVSGNQKINKGKAISNGKYPAYSASGQDIFLDTYGHEGLAVIISWIGARCGKCFLASGKWTAIANTQILKIKSEKEYDYKYLFYFLNDEKKWPRIGGAQPYISKNGAKNIEIPSPPIKIQKRIVARIEELFEKIDKAKELRKKALEETTNIFQSAFQEIYSKVERKYKAKILREVLNQIQYGLSKKMNEIRKGYRIFRMNNIVDYRMDEKNLKYVEINKNEFLKYKLEKGDVLFNRVNSFELVGKTGIFDLSGDYTFASYLIRLKANPDFLNSYFLNYFLKSPQTQCKLRFIARRAVQQANINAKEVSSLKIPLPPLSEQKKIVAYLDNLREKVEKLKQIQQKQLTELTELKQSILDKSFKDQL